jgi:hypothetical protein
VTTTTTRMATRGRTVMSARSSFDARTIAQGLAWDIGLPLIAYYALHLLGVEDFAALLAATAAAAVRIGWVAVRDRSLNLFATVMLLVFGIGLALAFMSGDARFLLLKGSIVTASVGVVFLITAARGRRPLTLAAEQSWAPSRAREIAEEYLTDPQVRRGHRVSSVVWGTVLLAEAAMRVPLVYLLPINIMVGLSTALLVVTIGGLVAWNARYATQAQRRAQKK